MVREPRALAAEIFVAGMKGLQPVDVDYLLSPAKK